MRGQAHRKDLAKQDIFEISIAPQFLIFKFEMHECSSATSSIIVCNALKVVSSHIISHMYKKESLTSQVTKTRKLKQE